MSGPCGNYEELATLVRRRSGARCVILICVEGSAGSGYSVSADQPVGDDLLAKWLYELIGALDHVEGDGRN